MKQYISVLLFCAALLGITSCSNEIADEAVNKDGTHTCRMYLDGNIGDYDGKATSRATVSIADMTTLHLYFGSNTATAVYHSSQKEWSLTYTGTLSASGSCSAYYIPNATENNGSIALTFASAIYSTSSGTYTQASDGSITVKLTLNPQLSRVRLKGISGTNVIIEGVKTPTSFTVSNHNLNVISTAISVTVGTNGYSEYIYYLEPSANSLSIISGSKQFNISNPLKSGGVTNYIDIPTETDHQGWTMTDTATHQ